MRKVDLKSTGRQAWQPRLGPLVGYIVIGVILMLLPYFLPTYLQSMATKILIFSIFALSLNLILGYAGLFSLGHAAFFGVAAYTLGILSVRYGVEIFWLVTPASILMATLVAAVFGVIALRLSGAAFILVTVALGEMVYSLAIKWREVTGGSSGFHGITPPNLGIPIIWTSVSFYYFVFLAFAICFFLLYRIAHSPFGQALQGIRDSEPRMRILGYNTWLYKYIAFVVAGLFAGVAGALYGHFYGLAAPVNCGIQTSTIAVLMVIIGSNRVFFGPVVGAAVVILLEYFVSISAPMRWPLILGAVFVITILFLRKGISVYLVRLWEKVRYGYGGT